MKRFLLVSLAAFAMISCGKKEEASKNVTGISFITGTTLTLMVGGDAERISVSITPGDAVNKSVTWTSRIRRLQRLRQTRA